MSRRRFFVPRDCIRDGVAALPRDQIHHLRDVLRLKTGDSVEVFDGEGAGYRGVIQSCEDQVLIGSLDRMHVPRELDSPILLAQALIKSDKYEWALQKATELGVREIIPLQTHFCDIRLSERKLPARVARWERIVREAAKQCRRLTVPKIHPPELFSLFLRRSLEAYDTRLLFYENAVRLWNSAIEIPCGATICIGPEGGWLPEEVEAAVRAGFQVLSLGNRVLRAETAALAALTLVHFRIAETSRQTSE